MEPRRLKMPRWWTSQPVIGVFLHHMETPVGEFQIWANEFDDVFRYDTPGDLVSPGCHHQQVSTLKSACEEIYQNAFFAMTEPA